MQVRIHTGFTFNRDNAAGICADPSLFRSLITGRRTEKEERRRKGAGSLAVVSSISDRSHAGAVDRVFVTLTVETRQTATAALTPNSAVQQNDMSKQQVIVSWVSAVLSKGLDIC